jgi:hypothetical protein
MRTKLPLALILLAALGLLAGCGKKSPNSLAAPGVSGSTGSSADQAAVAGTLSLTPQVVEDGECDSPDTSDVALGLGGHSGAIQGRRFWRTITGVSRSYQFFFADTDTTGQPTRAQVTVDKLFTGRFNVLVRMPAVDSTSVDSFYVVRKPLEDHWARRILLHRDVGTTRWHVVGTSGAKMTSQGAAARITSLRIQSADLDTTITDPLAFLYLRRIFKFTPGDSVRLTVTTLRSDDIVFMMRERHRPRFLNNGDGTYTATFRAPGRGGLAHFGVNALSNGALFNDTAPYDSQAWLFPFVGHVGDLAAQLP